MRQHLQLLTLWFVLWGIYLISAGDADVQEAVTGAIVSAGAAAVSLRARSKGESRYLPQWRWLVPFLKVPWTVLQECWLLLLALVRQVILRDFQGGSFIEFDLRPPRQKDDLAARLAVTAVGVCLTPNDYIVSIDESTLKARVRILVGRRLSGADSAFLELQ